MKTKKYYLPLLLSLVYGCQSTPSPNTKDFTVKADSSVNAAPQTSPQTSPSGPPADSFKIPNAPPSGGEMFKPGRQQEELKPIFDGVIPTDDPKYALPGSVTVIYKNEYQLRVNKEKQSINSVNEQASGSVDRILKKYDIKLADDLAYPGISEEQLESDVNKVSERYGIEAPDRRSIHTYQFAPDADTKVISAELRKLPYVRSAYMTPKIEIAATATLLSKHTLSTKLPKQTNDTGFNNAETTGWWWFNRSKIFQGWSAYKDMSNNPIAMPHLAIVDSGFDTRGATQDKPNYNSGESVKYDPFASPQWTIGTDVMQYQSDDPNTTFSHGAMVASVAASPKNNQVSPGDRSGLAGIAAGALVTPYKLQTYCTIPGSCGTASNWGYHTQSIAHGVFRASYSSADVINLSWGVAGGRPVIADPAINNEIIAASITRGKAVVIAAGNSNINIDYTNLDPTTSTLPACGECTIVGGSKYNTAYQSSQYLVSPTGGSNYGNRVDVTAGAQQITATSFQFSGGTPGVDQLLTANGTSLAAPMVAASIGMVKKMAAAHGSSLSLYKLRHLIIHSASSRRFTDSSSPTTTEFSFLGKGLKASSDWITQNPSAMVGMRELNLLNALTIAKYSNPTNGYDAIARVHNIDDFIWLAFNGNWGTYFQQGFGDDAIYGLDNLTSGDTISFATYNAGGGYAYGYQVYKNAEPMFDEMGGVAYVTGINSNTTYPTGWYNAKSYAY